MSFKPPPTRIGDVLIHYLFLWGESRFFFFFFGIEDSAAVTLHITFILPTASERSGELDSGIQINMENSFEFIRRKLLLFWNEFC